MTDSRTFALPQTGPFIALLGGGSVPIAGLTIVNQSNGAINVFVGTQSPSSSPSYTVPAQSQMGIPIAEANFVCVTFTGTTGSAYLHWSDTPVVALASPIVSGIAGSSGAIYDATYPDQFGSNGVGPITAIGTYTVIAPVAGESIYAWYIGLLTTGGDAGVTGNWYYGPSSSSLTPVIDSTYLIAVPNSTGYFNQLYGGGAVASTQQLVPAAIPLIFPAGDGLYLTLTAESQLHLKPWCIWSQHA